MYRKQIKENTTAHSHRTHCPTQRVIYDNWMFILLPNYNCMFEEVLSFNAELCFIRRCRFKLSARVSTIWHMGHLCCSGLCDFICFFKLTKSLLQTRQVSGANVEKILCEPYFRIFSRVALSLGGFIFSSMP